MRSIKIDQNAVLTIEKEVTENVPVIMVNLLRFRKHADYGERNNEKPCSGMEAYLERYVPAFNKVVEAEGIAGMEITYVGAVKGTVVTPAEEEWHIIALVSYPSFTAFRKVTESPLYSTMAAPHRLAALDDWRLIATVKADIV